MTRRARKLCVHSVFVGAIARPRSEKKPALKKPAGMKKPARSKEEKAQVDDLVYIYMYICIYVYVYVYVYVCQGWRAHYSCMNMNLLSLPASRHRHFNGLRCDQGIRKMNA